MPESTSREPVLHPYARISDPKQRKGRGLYRQVLDPQTRQAIAAFCEQEGFRPAAAALVDDGVSAFRGRHLSPQHALGKFLADAERGVIPAGDCLLIENWDRLSRQDVWAAVGLVNDLRQLGIHVGRLDRMKLLRADSTDPGDFFEAAVELMRGNSESAAKSNRLAASWRARRAAAREGGAVMTRRAPAWLEAHAGGFRVRAGAAAALRRLFELAAAGYGQEATIKRLNAEGLPAPGGGVWTRSYAGKLLADRRLLGELQPRRADRARTPDGPAIPDYYPRVLTDEEFYAAREGAAQRRVRRGALGKHVNVFAGLLRSASDGGTYHASLNISSKGRRARHRVLKNSASRQGGAPCRTFPLAVFEAAVLSRLREIDPHEILNGDSGPDETTALAADLGRVEEELAAAAAFMAEHGFSPTIGKRVTDLESRKRDLAGRLAEARQRAAHPLSESWGEAQSLAGALDRAADPRDARLRLRAALRRIVGSVWLLVVPRGRERLAAVQIHFAGGRHRDYLIWHRPATANASARAEGRWWARSFASAGVGEGLDLRRPDHAARLERVLLAAELP
jgi:DNA invertase Pin-like site-specific DNA recombinase